MLLYPDVQRHAQEQIDYVCGGERLPTMKDADALPYVRCLMKETLRKEYRLLQWIKISGLTIWR